MPLHISLAHQFEQQQEETAVLAFSQNGTHLVSSDWSAFSHWQLREDHTWAFHHSFPHGAGVFGIPFDIAYILEKDLIKLISFDEQEVATIPLPQLNYWAISPDLHWLIGNERDGGLFLRDLISQHQISLPLPFPLKMVMNATEERVMRFLFTPDGTRLVLFADSPEGSLHLCTFAPHAPHITVEKTLPHGMIDGVISPHGTFLALIVSNGLIAGYKEDIYLYDLPSGQSRAQFSPPKKTRYSLLAFSPDCRYLAGSRTDGWINIFSLTTFKCIAQFPAHPDLFAAANDPIGGLVLNWLHCHRWGQRV